MLRGDVHQLAAASSAHGPGKRAGAAEHVGEHATAHNTAAAADALRDDAVCAEARGADATVADDRDIAAGAAGAAAFLNCDRRKREAVLAQDLAVVVDTEETAAA